MRRVWLALIAMVLAGYAGAAGVPAQITYQGTLREKGIPSNGPKSIRFRVVNSNGTVLWSSASQNIQVTNGLFSVQLTPTGVDWQNVTPSLEVEIEGQTLSPSEPIAANIYALMSQSIVDGAVTPQKIAPGYGLVPSGGIMMFKTSCPSGWTVFTGLQGRFPVGADSNNLTQFTVGQSSGSLMHGHPISYDGDHNHSGATLGVKRGAPQTYGSPGGAPSGQYLEDIANQPLERASPHTHGINADGGHDHGGSSGDASSLPPYLTLIFCQKD